MSIIIQPSHYLSNYSFDPAKGDISFGVSALPYYTPEAFDPDKGDIRRVSLCMVEGLVGGILALPATDRPKRLAVNRGGFGVTGSGEQIRRTYSFTYDFEVSASALGIQPEA